jgi:ankyrin repeat protein
VFAGSLEAVEKVLGQAPAGSVDTRMMFQQTPLHVAIRFTPPWRDKVKIIQSLLAHGADITKQDSSQNNALHFAVCEPGDVLQLLLAGSPAREAKTAAVHAANLAGYTPLFTAVLAGNIDAVKALAAFDPSCLQFKDARGHTALHHAAQLTPHDDALLTHGLSYRMAAFLMLHGVRCEPTTADGDTALHYAAEKGSVDLVQLLRWGGAHVESLNNKQKTPLLLASKAQEEATRHNHNLFLYSLPGNRANRDQVVFAMQGPTPTEDPRTPRAADPNTQQR